MMSASASPEPQGTPASPKTTVQESRPEDVDTLDIAAAPPQPPLPPSDAAFTLPEIVHGIDPEDEDGEYSNERPIHQQEQLSQSPPPLLYQTGVSKVFSSLSAQMHRVVPFTNPDPIPQPPPAFFLFGDSLTEFAVTVSDPTAAPGWAALLREAYVDAAEVFVRGHSGYNTRWAIHILPRELRCLLRAGAAVKVATVFFGANDACVPGTDQHIPLDEYEKNLETMVCFIRSLSIIPLLVTPPPIVSSSPAAPVHRTPEITFQYARACNAVAKRITCAVLDLHTGFSDRAGPDGVDRFFVDGLHFSSAGNGLVYQLFIEKLSQIVPNLVPAALSRPSPAWKEIDPKNPSAVLGSSELLNA